MQEYIIEILVHWDLNERELDMVTEAIKAGLEDGSNDTREKAKVAYINIYHLFPDRAQKVKESLPRVQQMRLSKIEHEGEMLFQIAQGAEDKDILPLHADSADVADPIMSSQDSFNDSRQCVQLSASEKGMLASTLPTGSSFSLARSGGADSGRATHGQGKSDRGVGTDRLANTIDSSDLLSGALNASRAATSAAAAAAGQQHTRTPGTASKKSSITAGMSRNSVAVVTSASSAAGSKLLMKPIASSTRLQQQQQQAQPLSDSSNRRAESENVQPSVTVGNTGKAPSTANSSFSTGSSSATAALVSAKVKAQQQEEIRRQDAERQSRVRQTLLNRRKSVVSNPFANIIVTSPVNTTGETSAKLLRHNSTSALSMRSAAYRLAASGGSASASNSPTSSSGSPARYFNRNSFCGTSSGSPPKMAASNPTSPRQKPELSPTLASISEKGAAASKAGASSPFARPDQAQSAYGSPANRAAAAAAAAACTPTTGRSIADVNTPKTESRSTERDTATSADRNRC